MTATDALSAGQSSQDIPSRPQAAEMPALSIDGVSHSYGARQALIDIGVPPEDAPKLKVFRGAGCPNCTNTGYRGRIAIYEVMVIREEIKEFILNGASASEIKREAMRLGMARSGDGHGGLVQREGRSAPMDHRARAQRRSIES